MGRGGLLLSLLPFLVVRFKISPKQLLPFSWGPSDLVKQVRVIRLLIVFRIIPGLRLGTGVVAIDGGELFNQIERNLPAGGYSGGAGNTRPQKQGVNAGIALNGKS